MPSLIDSLIDVLWNIARLLVAHLTISFNLIKCMRYCSVAVLLASLLFLKFICQQTFFERCFRFFAGLCSGPPTKMIRIGRCWSSAWEVLSRTKSIDVNQIQQTELRRCLSVVDLIALGKLSHCFKIFRARSNENSN
jgi:hypothetical protein